MASYLYLVLGLIFLAAAALAGIVRPDLRKGIICVGIGGAIWGPISEIWFFRDYWHPESVIGHPILEDIIYGAGIAAVASCIFKVVTRRTTQASSGPRTHYREAALMVLLYIAAMVALQMALKVNSILVAIAVYVIAACYVVARRRDLWTASVCTAVMMGVVAVCGYGLGLNFLVPEPRTLAQIWLLYGKPLGVEILGYVPVTEVIWYTAWGLLLGVLYEFATGQYLIRLKSISAVGEDASVAHAEISPPTARAAARNEQGT